MLLTPVVLNKLLTGGYILLTSLSILLTCSIAKFASAALPAPSAFFPKNIASGLFDVGLTADTTLSIVLFILDELSTRSLPYPATLPTVLPAPYINGKYKTESAPNLARFNNFLTASFCVSSASPPSKSTSLFTSN